MSTLSLTIIQTDLFWEDKKRNLDMLESKIHGIQENTEIVLLPEMFNTGFSMEPAKLSETMEGETLLWMKKIASEKNVILGGSIIIEDNQTEFKGPEIADQRGSFFNRLIWMLPNGQFGIYDKRHLFSFAGEDKYFLPGKKRLISSVNGWKINLLVCYDLRFPVWARQQQRPNPEATEYDVLIYVANWPEKRRHAWKTLLQARAIENQCYVVGVNRIGVDGKGINYAGESMVVDPLGQTLYLMNEKEEVHTITLDMHRLQQAREQFPFLRDRDKFELEEGL